MNLLTYCQVFYWIGFFRPHSIFHDYGSFFQFITFIECLLHLFSSLFPVDDIFLFSLLFFHYYPYHGVSRWVEIYEKRSTDIFQLSIQNTISYCQDNSGLWRWECVGYISHNSVRSFPVFLSFSSNMVGKITFSIYIVQWLISLKNMNWNQNRLELLNSFLFSSWLVYFPCKRVDIYSIHLLTNFFLQSDDSRLDLFSICTVQWTVETCGKASFSLQNKPLTLTC